MQEKTRPYRRRVPRALGTPPRSVCRIFERALSLTASMDSHRHIILAIAFSHALEIPQQKFEFALRRFKRRKPL